MNTIYVDKNLKYHGLIQAYSRTNRIQGQKKSQGNIVCFRNLKPATDKAIELFANKDAQEEIILAPYEDYIEKIEEAVANLLAITPDVASVDDLLTEEDEAKFIQAFREVIRIKNVLDCFTEFDFRDLPMDEQLFADFRSKYLDLYDKVRSERQKEKVSILDDIDLLNEQSQQVFRNLMDKYSENILFLASCLNIQKVIESLQSRFFITKLPNINKEIISDIFQKIKTNENIVIDLPAEKFIINLCSITIKRAYYWWLTRACTNYNFINTITINISRCNVYTTCKTGLKCKPTI